MAETMAKPDKVSNLVVLKEFNVDEFRGYLRDAIELPDEKLENAVLIVPEVSAGDSVHAISSATSNHHTQAGVCAWAIYLINKHITGD